MIVFTYYTGGKHRTPPTHTQKYPGLKRPTEVLSGEYRFKVGGPGLKLTTGGPRGASSAWNDHHSWGGGYNDFQVRHPINWLVARCSIDSSATISRVQHDVAAMSHPITRVTIDVHTAPRARDATAIFAAVPYFGTLTSGFFPLLRLCFLFCGCDGGLSLLHAGVPLAFGLGSSCGGEKSMLALSLQRRFCWLPLLMRPCGLYARPCAPNLFGHKLRDVRAVRSCSSK